MSFFGMIEPELAKSAREHLTLKQLKKGEELFAEGGNTKGVYLMRKGKVKISHTNDEGKESIIYIYKRGEFFGYRPLLAGEPNPVTACALDDAEVYFLPASVFLDILEKSDTLAKQLLMNLSSEFTVWISKMTLFAQYPVKQRVALSLLILCQVYGTSGKAKPSISISRDDLASFVGTAKETVVRMLRVFKDEKIIAAKGAKITIIDPEALKEIVTML